MSARDIQRMDLRNRNGEGDGQREPDLLRCRDPDRYGQLCSVLKFSAIAERDVQVMDTGACCFFDQQLTDEEEDEKDDAGTWQVPVRRTGGFAGRSCR